MKKLNWLITIITLSSLFLLIVIFINVYIDTYAIRSSLFSADKEVNQVKFMEGINQHIFNPEYIFRYPNRFDSFLFGSSRSGVINVGKIKKGDFYNMSYNQGIPSEHLMIIKAFLRKKVKIKLVVIGLDEFSFSRTQIEHENSLLRQMHPYITGKSLTSIFYLYYFRMPQLFELANGKNKLLSSRQEYKFTLDESGTNLCWMNAEKKIVTSGKPIYFDKDIVYNPFHYDKAITADVFRQIEELITLSKKYNFRLIFFFNPIRIQGYLNYALDLIPIKERLSAITDFYDFSGFNYITTNNMHYYDNDHYRYLVGDMIAERILGHGKINVFDDFGILVTSKNVGDHNKKQKIELEKYLKTAKNKQEKI
ncbi:MAG: hypothetical protein CVU62_02710 [Deltaproteobacteria bacterium HGW-Deltaproteobacteria-2]|jgi:hypothetical protein|nr:MAG: hypothetical protein CVU62_02710 [Deltaproteobacteria bacterium HGW-Deltaproteobacteria-2]